MSCSLPGIREYALDLPRNGGLFERGETEEGTNGGQAQVARPDADRPACLEIVEEGADERGVELGQIEPRGRLAQLRLRVREKQPERVAVSCEGVRSGVALLHEALGEEALDERWVGSRRES